MVPVLIGDAVMARRASQMLLDKWNIYVQAVNFPTVPEGTERLRFAPTPGHGQAHIDHLVKAMDSVWNELGLRRTDDWAREGVSEILSKDETPEMIWTREQLGVTNLDQEIYQRSCAGKRLNKLP
jgi:5-aminolevulinate synthase